MIIPRQRPDPRSAGHADHLVVAEPMVVCEYDVVGEHNGRWVVVQAEIDSVEQARRTVAEHQLANPSITWHIIRRITTIVEDLADDLLTSTPASKTDAASKQ